MKNSKITITQIAEHAGVSTATVSRIINHKDNVKPDTRQKVLDVMEELQFQPKSPATITNSDSKVLLMVVPDFSNPFNAPVINGVQNAAHEHGYDVLILQSMNYYTNSSHYLNIIKNNSLAGILILAAAPHSELLEELSFRCPVVMCSEYAEDYGVSYVSIDDVESSRKAVEYLISTGCKKIALLNSNSKFKYTRHREKGYIKALEEAGMNVNPDWIVNTSSINYKLAFSNATHLLSLPDRPDAIFASSDVFAFSAIMAAKALGLSVPEDVSVIGFDNIELSAMSDPALTTIDQPAYGIGFQACELLVEKIRNPKMPDRQVILDTQLIVRGSTKMRK